MSTPDLGLAITDACKDGRSLTFAVLGDELAIEIIGKKRRLCSSASVRSSDAEVIAFEVRRAISRLNGTLAIVRNGEEWTVVRGDGVTVMHSKTSPTILFGDEAREFLKTVDVAPLAEPATADAGLDIAGNIAGHLAAAFMREPDKPLRLISGRRDELTVRGLHELYRIAGAAVNLSRSVIDRWENEPEPAEPPDESERQEHSVEVG